MNKVNAMKRMLLVVLLGLPVILHGQEKITLTTPAFVTATGVDFRLSSLHLQRTHPDRPANVLAIYSEVDGTAFLALGRTIGCRYDGAEADALIVLLNKANLSTISLEKRLMTKCKDDTKIPAGTISGSVQ